MKKKPKNAKKGRKKSGSDMLIAHRAVKKFIKDAGDNNEDEVDPRLQNLKPVISRKTRRKQERQAKKARIRAFHSQKHPEKQNQGPATDKQNTATDGKVEKKETEVKVEEDRRQKETVKRKREQNRGRRQKKNAEKRRKQELLEANKMEEKNIKRLEKSLRFRKKKKTKEVIIPGQFKYDGLDYILDVVDSKKLEMLKEASEDMDGEIDLKNAEEHKNQLAARLGGDTDEGEGSDCDSRDDDEEEDGMVGGGFDEFGESDDERSDGDVGWEDGRDRDGSGDEETDQSEDSVVGKDEDVMSHEVPKKEPSKFKQTGEKDTKETKDKKRKAERSDRRKHSEDNEDNFEDRLGNVEKRTEPKMDPYGNVMGQEEEKSSSTYIPPHRRAMMMGENLDEKRKVELQKLRRQLKGLLNRLSASNVTSISREVESLYQTRSRNDMNETLCSLIQESLVMRSMSADRLVMEAVLLISILHFNIGSEVGAHFLQSMAVKFDELHRNLKSDDLENKECDNAVLVLVHLYNFRIVHCCLMYDIIKRLVDSFTEQDIEMLLLLLKNAGMSLRKDDPLALKEIILLIQGKAASCSEEFRQQSRVSFMLETIAALKNNDIRKIGNTNLEHLDNLRKALRNLTKNRDHSTESNLRIPLEDLLSADQKGRWWIVGSAWTGHGPNSINKKIVSTDSSVPVIKVDESTSEKIMELSRQQRMNTDLRRSIFGLVMTAEDYQDCVDKLLQLGVKTKQEKECVLVVIDCCQQERQFNPYYAHVLSKLCHFDRKFRIAFQFAYWDRFKILDQVSKTQLNNLACLYAHLLLTKASSLSILKVIEFADISKNTANFLKKLLLKVLAEKPDQIKMVFEAVAGIDKLSHLRDMLSLFLHHFILKQVGSRSEEEQCDLKEKIAVAESSLKGDKEVNF
ncbi:Nucleolar MIF4G domain-containing protein 1 [Holothuria leucospilota]|uniref:Nucleolar MIF4G domain-containing protein 1 n=1 Tax=Holothuria leucospilota TaxID=206669 RepID=A0A9Q0YP18_HOLLE|nr:Nucleolar MIF4G domain-containing protein 1 [Holothuria leucospilota]